MIIRGAKLSDTSAIVELGKDAIASGVWGDHLSKGFDELEAYKFVLSVIPHNLVFVADVGGEVVGAMVLRMDKWIWSSRDFFIEGVMFYVREGYRSIRTSTGDLPATALIKKAKALSDESGYRLSLQVWWGSEETIEIRDEYMRRHFDYSGGTFSHTPVARTKEKVA